jgi:hypothetical protein
MLRATQILRSAVLKSLCTVFNFCVAATSIHAQDDRITLNPDDAVVKSQETGEASADDADDVLSPDKWKRVDTAVDRALAWLDGTQRRDGSFPSIDAGQPGVTALCVMAFLAHGHVPGEGSYGRQIEHAANYVMSSQKDNGLISLLGPEGARLSRRVPDSIGDSACYNHAISSLMLSELYGMSNLRKTGPMRETITKSIAATLEMQRWPKDRREDRGGWRYLNDSNEIDSDLSLTGWQLMFLRSARNAGFNVPAEPIDDAVAYVRRCFDEEHGVFTYSIGRAESRSRGMAGAGILALAHAGFHNADEARRSGDWLLDHSFQRYNTFDPVDRSWRNDRYHYGLFNSCQGMYQLGGRYWKQFFPQAVELLLDNQRHDGSWQAERYNRDGQFGNAYTTALAVLSLGAPNQLLPIFQR